MSMPVLPGLQQSQGTPGPLTDILDALSPEQINDLVGVAQDWSDSGEPPNPIVDDPNATVDTDMDTPQPEPLPGDNAVPHDETAETLDQEAAETPEEQTAEGGAENIEGLMAQVQEVAQRAEGYPDQFDALIEQATTAEAQGADPDKISDLKDEADDYVKEIEKMMKEGDKAAKDEDAEGLASIGLAISKHCDIIDDLLQQAQTFSTGHQPPPAAPGAIQSMPALAMWAKRYGESKVPTPVVPALAAAKK